MIRPYNKSEYLIALDDLVQDYGVRMRVPITVGISDTIRVGRGCSYVVTNKLLAAFDSFRDSSQSGAIVLGVQDIPDKDVLPLSMVFDGVRTIYHEIRHVSQYFNKNMPEGELGTAIRLNASVIKISPKYYGGENFDKKKPIVTDDYWNNVCELDAELYSWQKMSEWLCLQGMRESEIESYCCGMMNRIYYDVNSSVGNYICPTKPFDSYQEGLNCLDVARQEAVHAPRSYDWNADTSAFGELLRRDDAKGLGDEIANEKDGLKSVAKIIGIACRMYPRFSEQCHFTEDDMNLLTADDLYEFDVGSLTYGSLKGFRKDLKSKVGHVDGDDVYTSFVNFNDSLFPTEFDDTSLGV